MKQREPLLRPRFCHRVNRPNVFIKIPGTPAGLQAVEEAIISGVPINITSLFTPEQYGDAANAYLKGIERRIAASMQPAVPSVASVFVSRWDVAVQGARPRNFADNLGFPLPRVCMLATEKYSPIHAGRNPSILVRYRNVA